MYMNVNRAGFCFSVSNPNSSILLQEPEPDALARPGVLSSFRWKLRAYPITELPERKRLLAHHPSGNTL